MKYFLAAIAAIVCASAMANDVTVYRSNGETIFLYDEPCRLEGFPVSAKRAIYSAYVPVADACWMRTGPETVLVSIKDTRSIVLERHQFKQWGLK